MALNPVFRAEETYGVVVVAADGVGSALVAGADTDDGDGGAGEADKDVHALDDDAKQAEERRSSGVASLCGRGIQQ